MYTYSRSFPRANTLSPCLLSAHHTHTCSESCAPRTAALGLCFRHYMSFDAYTHIHIHHTHTHTYSARMRSTSSALCLYLRKYMSCDAYTHTYKCTPRAHECAPLALMHHVCTSESIYYVTHTHTHTFTVHECADTSFAR